MTKDQIKAELRRSACEDKYPSSMVEHSAWEEQFKWRDRPSQVTFEYNVQRTFFLLIAEALED